MSDVIDRRPDDPISGGDARFRVPLRDVERELNRQMKLLQGADERPLQRARMSNLVIFCNSLEQAIEINQQVPAITGAHPARTLLVIGEPHPEHDVTARVTVRPIGDVARQHIYAEQVTLHAGGSAVYRLPFAVRALLIGDLPINLWWAVPEPPPFAGQLLADLGERAQQIIYDSIGWQSPAEGLAATAGWLEQVEHPGLRWRVASDLNWRRLKYWRRALVQAVDPHAAPGVIESATELVVEHGPHAVVQAWLLACWIAARLNWTVKAGKVAPGVEMTWRGTTPRGEARVRLRRLDSGPPTLRRIRVNCALGGAPCALDMTFENDQRLVVRTEGVESAPRSVWLPPQSAEELVGRQLSDRERDPNFHEALAIARVMAESVLR